MIIFGTKSVTKNRGNGEFFCPFCVRECYYHRRELKQYLHIFFVPVLPVKDYGEYIECHECRREYDLTVLDYQEGFEGDYQEGFEGGPMPAGQAGPALAGAGHGPGHGPGQGPGHSAGQGDWGRDEGRANSGRAAMVEPATTKKPSFFKFMGILFAGMMVLCLAGTGLSLFHEYVILSPEDREARAAKGPQVVENLTLVANNMPSFNAVNSEFERNCPEQWRSEEYSNAPYAHQRFFEQFQGQSIELQYDLDERGWMTSGALQEIQTRLQRNVDPTEWSHKALERTYDEILDSRFIQVIYSYEAYLPRTGGSNAEYFDSGYFDGWVVVVDQENPGQFCFAQFEALNSEYVETSGSFSRAVLNDFTGNFRRAKDDGIRRVMAGQALSMDSAIK